MGTKLKWHGNHVMSKFENEMSKRLDTCALIWVNEAKTGLSRNLSKNKGGRGSKPGEYLAKDEGHLRRNIAWERNGKLQRRVGTNVEYGAEWQLAPPSIRRPWMTLTNEATKPKIRHILNQRIK